MWGVDSLSFHNSNEVYRYQRIDGSQVRPLFYSGRLWIMCRAFEWTIASKYTRQKEWSLFDIVVPNRCHGDSFDCDRIWQRSLRLSSGLNKRTAVWIRKQLHTFLPISCLFSSKWMIMIWMKKNVDLLQHSVCDKCGLCRWEWVCLQHYYCSATS